MAERLRNTSGEKLKRLVKHAALLDRLDSNGPSSPRKGEIDVTESRSPHVTPVTLSALQAEHKWLQQAAKPSSYRTPVLSLQLCLQ